MKSLIVGSRGLVGSALKRQLPDAIEGIPVEPKKKNQYYVDITKYETLFKVFSRERPDVVYLASAIAHVDKCEESAGTDTVNVRGATTVVRLCESFGSKLVYFSSSYVFDGSKKSPYVPKDETCPINIYGKQKETVENIILQSDVNSVIVRTVGVYGTERLKKNFAKQIISVIFSGQKVFIPSDQIMNPVLSDDLARVTIRLAEKHRGLYHVSGDTCLSKYDFAMRIAKYFGMENLVIPKTSEDMQQKAKRPKNGCLDCSHLLEIGIPIPSFDMGLTKFLGQEFNG